MKGLGSRINQIDKGVSYLHTMVTWPHSSKRRKCDSVLGGCCLLRRCYMLGSPCRGIGRLWCSDLYGLWLRREDSLMPIGITPWLLGWCIQSLR